MTENIRKTSYMADLLSWFFLYYAILITGLYTLNKDIRSCLLALLTVIPFAGCVLLSQRAKNAVYYILYHAALLGLIWLCHSAVPLLDLSNALLLSAAVLVPFILFFTKRMHTAKDTHYLKISPYMAIIFFILWIIADQMAFGALATLLLVCACVFLLMCILGQYLNNLYAYVENNAQVANMPLGAILHSSHGVMAIFMVLALACILLFTNLGLGRFITALKDLLLSGLRFLLSLAPESEPADFAPTEIIEETQGSGQMPMMMDDGGTSPIMVAISNVIFTILQIALIIGAAALIIYTIYQLYRRFGSFSFNKKDKAADGQDCNDVIEKIITPKKQRRSIFSGNRMPEDKIRRIYYKKIQSNHKKEPVPVSFTPTQLTQTLGSSDNEAGARLTQLYEKARYSPHETTSEDIAMAKSLSKKL